MSHHPGFDSDARTLAAGEAVTRNWTMLLACLVVLALPNTASAWGGDGHKVVCDIAWRELTSETKKKIRTINRGDSYETFAESCVWPDDIRSDDAYDWAKPHHYINVPVDSPDVERDRDCLERGCLLSAIARAENNLGDEEKQRSAMRRALRFLGHFIGDIHQPLHVSYARDRGGNDIKVKFFTRKRKLHAIWDTDILLRMMAIGAEHYDRLTWRQFGWVLHGGITDADRAAWNQGEPIDWADESLDITQHEDAEYDLDTDGKTLGQAYVDANAPKIRMQIKKAGVRLGAALNRILVDD